MLLYSNITTHLLVLYLLVLILLLLLLVFLLVLVLILLVLVEDKATEESVNEFAMMNRVYELPPTNTMNKITKKEILKIKNITIIMIVKKFV